MFSSRATALVSRFSRLRRSHARALLSLNLKKRRDCSQSKTPLAKEENWTLPKAELRGREVELK